MLKTNALHKDYFPAPHLVSVYFLPNPVRIARRQAIPVPQPQVQVPQSLSPLVPQSLSPLVPIP
jgi:hypothetical protein